MALSRVRRLRVRFGALYLRRKAAYVRRKRFAMYRCVTLNYAHISVSCRPTGAFSSQLCPRLKSILSCPWDGRGGSRHGVARGYLGRWIEKLPHTVSLGA